MFKKILIANRGEIACRVIKTARRMGIKTVGVYSEADRDALHVEMADEAVLIGPPAAAESYLLIDRIVDACKKTGSCSSGPIRTRSPPWATRSNRRRRPPRQRSPRYLAISASSMTTSMP